MLEALNLSHGITRTLKDNGWGLSMLAVATPEQLMAYPGIGKVMAEKIIERARVAVLKQAESEGTITDPKRAREALAADGWTDDLLATSDIRVIAEQYHLDDVLAQKIIGQARQAVNWNLYLGGNRYEPPEPAVKKVSVRLQRILDKRAGEANE